MALLTTGELTDRVTCGLRSQSEGTYSPIVVFKIPEPWYSTTVGVIVCEIGIFELKRLSAVPAPN